MLKAVFLLPRRKDLSREEFVRFWRDTHVALVRALPGLRRCLFSEVVSAPSGEELPCDAMVELWWDDLPAVRTAIDSNEARACEESLAHFVDLPRWQVFLAREEDQ
jgi:uncharacterized protein (TIGR02118 family)